MRALCITGAHSEPYGSKFKAGNHIRSIKYWSGTLEYNSLLSHQDTHPPTPRTYLSTHLLQLTNKIHEKGEMVGFKTRLPPSRVDRSTGQPEENVVSVHYSPLTESFTGGALSCRREHRAAISVGGALDGRAASRARQQPIQISYAHKLFVKNPSHNLLEQRQPRVTFFYLKDICLAKIPIRRGRRALVSAVNLQW